MIHNNEFAYQGHFIALQGSQDQELMKYIRQQSAVPLPEWALASSWL